jgi:ABC-2 type transport system permease protein
MIQVEFAKQLRRIRTVVVAAICVVVPVLIGVGSYLSSNDSSGGGGGGDSSLQFATRHAGLVVGIESLSLASFLLIPIVFAIYAGDTVASEAKWGSLRYLLVRPVTRPRLLTSKLVVAAVLAVATAMLIPVVGTIVGVAFFGWHPIQTVALSGSAGGGASLGGFLGAPPVHFVTFSPGDAFARLLLASAYVLFGAVSVLGVSFLVGVATENTLAAVSAGIGVYIVSAIVEAISGLRSIRPVLPTTYLQGWSNLFVPGSAPTAMWHGVVVAAIWAVATIGLAYAVFRRRDIIS